MKIDNNQVDNLTNALVVITLAIFALAIICIIYKSHRQPIEERAAYLEGRFNLDHATAIAYAESEVR